MKTYQVEVLDELLALVRFYRDAHPSMHPKVREVVVDELIAASLRVAARDDLDGEATQVDLNPHGAEWVQS